MADRLGPQELVELLEKYDHWNEVRGAVDWETCSPVPHCGHMGCKAEFSARTTVLYALEEIRANYG